MDRRPFGSFVKSCSRIQCRGTRCSEKNANTKISQRGVPHPFCYCVICHLPFSIPGLALVKPRHWSCQRRRSTLKGFLLYQPRVVPLFVPAGLPWDRAPRSLLNPERVASFFAFLFCHL